MLYPLMLEAYKHIPFQPWLRSDLEGIDPVVFDQMLKGATRLRKGVLTHVTAQAYLQRKFSSTHYSVRQQIKSAGMTSDMIKRNVRGLRHTHRGPARSELLHRLGRLLARPLSARKRCSRKRISFAMPWLAVRWN